MSVSVLVFRLLDHIIHRHPTGELHQGTPITSWDIYQVGRFEIFAKAVTITPGHYDGYGTIRVSSLDQTGWLLEISSHRSWLDARIDKGGDIGPLLDELLPALERDLVLEDLAGI